MTGMLKALWAPAPMIAIGAMALAIVVLSARLDAARARLQLAEDLAARLELSMADVVDAADAAARAGQRREAEASAVAKSATTRAALAENTAVRLKALIADRESAPVDAACMTDGRVHDAIDALLRSGS